MGKVDEALAAIQQQSDSTERALLVGGVLSTLMRIRGAELVLVGDLAYDCYVNNSNSGADLVLCVLKGQLTPRLIQEVMVEEMHAKGRIWNWECAGVTIRFGGQVITEYPALCREFKTDYGVARLIPAEELVAERILSAFYPVADPEARAEARRVLALAHAEAFVMDWHILANLCASPTYRMADELDQLKREAVDEVERAVAEAAELDEDEAEDVEPVPPKEFESGDAYQPVGEAAAVTGLRRDTGRLPMPEEIRRMKEATGDAGASETDDAPAEGDLPPSKRETTHLSKPAVPGNESA